MKIAFYAPMKPPDSDVPSGDRESAALLIRMLGELGHEVEIASRLVTWRAAPEPCDALETASGAEAERLLSAWTSDPPALWLTYHLYHKAPDWLGPRMADALAIPYAVIEACRTARLSSGPWAEMFGAADRALARADAVAAVHREDEEGLAAVVAADRRHLLPPAIDAAAFEPVEIPADRAPVLLAVGMMRPGDKLTSYRVLGEALEMLEDRAFILRVAGDGPAREEALGALPEHRLDWRGAVAKQDLPDLYAGADLFVWPAVNEAFGMALLEAQAAGLPAVAGRTGGVPDIVADGETGLLTQEGDAASFARALGCLLDAPDRRRKMGLEAAKRVRGVHDLPVARARLAAFLDAARATHMRRAGAGS